MVHTQAVSRMQYISKGLNIDWPMQFAHVSRTHASLYPSMLHLRAIAPRWQLTGVSPAPLLRSLMWLGIWTLAGSGSLSFCTT
ncbi:hypothetical protein PFISCL1PPCAC_8593, partial [Pristionchus fissidentatus]